MSLLTEETAVFSAATGDGKHGQRCAVAFFLRRSASVPTSIRTEVAKAVTDVLAGFSRSNWRLSVRAMIDANAYDTPTVYATGFAHDVDFVGVFEAPSIDSAVEGTLMLERAGWVRLFATEWLIGPREFAPVRGANPNARRDWGFIALWEWNDVWNAATPAERKEYDAECDVAFAFDVESGIDIAGRHRFDWASRWHHLGVWEAESIAQVDAAMRAHERAADFKYTTSRHFIGPKKLLSDLLGADHG